MFKLLPRKRTAVFSTPHAWHHKLRTRLAVLACSALIGCGTTPSQTTLQNTRGAPSGVQELPQMKRFKTLSPAPIVRSNTAIARDFLDLTFQLENGTNLQHLTRFEGPITLRVTGSSIPASLGPDLDILIKRLRTEAGIDITRVAPNVDANITIQTLPHDDLRKRAPNTACIVAPNISSWDGFRRSRRANLSWSAVTQRQRLAIFIPNDEAPQEIRDCLHEELAQSLGPLNDLYRLDDSVFNDDNIHSVLTKFDMLILRATYAPELRNGMTRNEVAQRLPALLSRLNPAGDRISTLRPRPTPRAWIDDVAIAMGAQSSVQARRAAASRAVQLAQNQGWNDTRTGFSLFLLGRLSVGADPDLAYAALMQAHNIYSARPATTYHAAHVALQLSALALLERDYDKALKLTSAAMPAAYEAGNAALLASLMLTKAEALGAIGRASEAQLVRLDSLGWARYGFGSDEQVLALTRDVANLARR